MCFFHTFGYYIFHRLRSVSAHARLRLTRFFLSEIISIFSRASCACVRTRSYYGSSLCALSPRQNITAGSKCACAASLRVSFYPKSFPNLYTFDTLSQDMSRSTSIRRQDKGFDGATADCRDESKS